MLVLQVFIEMSPFFFLCITSYSLLLRKVDFYFYLIHSNFIYKWPVLYL